MENLQVIIVDDEFLALNLLENFLSRVPGVTVAGKFKSPLEALHFLQQEPVDLLFLDIQMPSLSGNNLLRSLPNPPVTIFTTAYPDFAVEAYELNAVDYLLKPFSFERFLQAFNKARAAISPREAGRPAETTQHFMTIKADGKFYKVPFKEIRLIEGLKEYVRFHCGARRYVVLESMRNLEQTLPSQRFIRVHKSYIVGVDWVQAVDGHELQVEQHKVPISRSKRDWVVQQIFYPDDT